MISVTFAGLLFWTWRSWPDVLIDFGRELYVPWQLASGKTLYADIAYFNGPLSPYINTLAFKLFGVGLSTLIWTNVAVLMAIVLSLYAAVRGMSDDVTAAIACTVFLPLFAFQNGGGSYNYIAPYSHEMTHGILLALAALLALQRWRGERSLWWVALSGIIVGLECLTKPEILLAGSSAAGLALAAHMWNRRFTRRRIASGVFAFTSGALVVPSAVFALLAVRMPAATAWRGITSAWPGAVVLEVSRLRFYTHRLGVDTPAINLVRMLLSTAILAGTFASVMAIAWVTKRGRAVALVVFVVVAIGASALAAGELWLEFSRCLPVVVVVIAIGAIVHLGRNRGDPRPVTVLAFSALSLVLLGKMLLNARLYNYGFVLAMPATILLATLLFGWIPSWLGCRGKNSSVFRRASTALLAGLLFFHLGAIARANHVKRFQVGGGRDAFRADGRGLFVQQALDWLRSSSHRSLAVLPEGVMINYLARLENPTPYVNFMPPELILFGEEKMVGAFRAHPPDVILVVHKDTTEYGLPLFGKDYGRDLFRWIADNYRVVRVFGEPPLRKQTRFGIAVLGRRDPQAPVAHQ